MQNTTNYSLKKPEYTDTADINKINENMDAIDTALGGLGSGIAIVSIGNTHDAILAGQYVYVHGHSSLAEGLYVARSDISAPTPLSSSNLQAAGGAFNVMKTIGDSLTEKWSTNYGNTTTPITSLDDLPLNGGGNCVLSAALSPSGAVAAWAFDKRGTSSRYAVKVTRIAASSMQTYVGKVYDASFSGWELVPYDGEVSHMANEVWSTSLVVESSHALVLISQVYRVIVWLSSTSGIDISVESFGTSSSSGYRKHSNSNSITFGASSSDTTFTITRNNDGKFTIKTTDNTTNYSWKALY